MARILSRLRFVFNLKRFFPFLIDFFRSSEVSTGKKVVSVGLIVGYLILPFDVIPDFLIVLGFVDDIVVLTFMLQQIVKMAPASIKEKHQLEEKK